MKAKRQAYLDWASAAPVHPKAQRALTRALRLFGNPSSPHEEGRLAKECLEGSRTRIARLAGVKPRAVIFTSGATEANALAIQGRVKRCRASGTNHEDMHILYLPTMHSSVVKTLEEVGKLGVQIEPLVLTAASAIDLEVFEKQLRSETILVCVDAVCGETGTRFDTLRLRRVIDARPGAHTAQAAKRPALHIDASQLPLVEPIEHMRLGADMLVLDAQKVSGVRGIGALIIPDQNNIAPIAYGGGQEVGLRPGTEPVALIAAFSEALALRASAAEQFQKSANGTREQLVSTIQASIPSVLVHEAKRQAPHILNISLPGIDTDYLVMLLDRAGFAVSTKSACETDSEDGSRVIFLHAVAQGVSEEDALARAASTLRISWGPETPQKAITAFAKALLSSVRFLEESAI